MNRLVYSREEVFKADMILKVSPVTPAETDLLKPKQTLISALQIGIQQGDYFRGLMAKKVTALGFELSATKRGFSLSSMR